MDRGRGLERLNSIYDFTQPQPYVMDGVKHEENGICLKKIKKKTTPSLCHRRGWTQRTRNLSCQFCKTKMLFISISPATHPWVSSHAWLLSMNSINIMRRKYPWAGRRINIYWIRAPAWETRKWNILMWFNGRKESFRHRSSKGFFTWENSQGLQSFWFCSLWMICDHQEKYLSFSSFSKSIFKYISLFCLNLEKATATPCRGISGIWKVLFVLSSSGHSSPLWEFHTRNTNVNTSTSTSTRNANASSAITKIKHRKNCECCPFHS